MHYNYRLQEVLKESGYLDEVQDEFYSVPELMNFGFQYVGKNSRISRKSSFYAISCSIGDDVRIDDFCILKGNIEIGHNVHICAYSMLSGVGGLIKLDDFSVLAARCSIYTASNDHSADAMPAPLSPPEFTKQIFGPVRIGIGVLVGAHVVILPGVTLETGSSVGAGCIVSKSLQEGEMLRSPKPVIATHKRDVHRIKTLVVRYFENKTGEV